MKHKHNIIKRIVGTNYYMMLVQRNHFCNHFYDHLCIRIFKLMDFADQFYWKTFWKFRGSG